MRQEFLAALDSIAQKRNLGQRDIASVSGVDESQLSRIRRGRRSVNFVTAASIISIFEDADQRALVVAWIHDAIRGLGFEPAQFPVGNLPRESQLNDLADPALAQVTRALLNRTPRNPAIRQCLKSLEEMTRPVAANPAKRIAISKGLNARRKAIKQRTNPAAA